MQANVEAVRVAGLVTTLVSMAGDNRRMDSLPNSVGPRVSTEHVGANTPSFTVMSLSQ